MQSVAPDELEQVRGAAELIRNVFQDSLLALYLHGSAVSGTLRPQSDIDLLAVIDRPMIEAERDNLLSALLQRSGCHPVPAGGPRSLELMLFLEADLVAPDYPMQAEFIYGEWLRDHFEAGELPLRVSDPAHTLTLAQARQEAVLLYGPRAPALLPEIPPDHVRRAMRDLLPALLKVLPGDERNVLLTLARMWHTAVTDEFITKDAAAAWAESRLPALEAAHIRPYGEGGGHDARNGLLLRRDIHSLFDAGYVTVTPDLRFEVSRRIREEFENGRHYYALHGQPIHAPEDPLKRPDPVELTWHNEQCFRG